MNTWKPVLASFLLILAAGCESGSTVPEWQSEPLGLPVQPIRNQAIKMVLSMRFNYNTKILESDARRQAFTIIVNQLNQLGSSDGNTFSIASGQIQNFNLSYVLNCSSHDQRYSGYLEFGGWGRGNIATIHSGDFAYSDGGQLIHALTEKFYRFIHEGWRDTRRDAYPAMGPLDVRLTNDPNGEKGVNFAYYEGGWEVLPDLDDLTPKKTGVAAYFDIGKRDRNDYFAFKFTGFVKIAAKGTYYFSTASDDGSRLLIGDKVVVNNDGCHGVLEVIGRIDLEPGMHPITVLFFETWGAEELSVGIGNAK